MARILARIGAALYCVWGAVHVFVSWQILELAGTQEGLAQGRLFQLAAYMFVISVFAIVIASWLNWRNDPLGYWLNLALISTADLIWVLVVVLLGYVPPLRGLVPPAVWMLGLIFTTLGYRSRKKTTATM